MGLHYYSCVLLIRRIIHSVSPWVRLIAWWSSWYPLIWAAPVTDPPPRSLDPRGEGMQSFRPLTRPWPLVRYHGPFILLITMLGGTQSSGTGHSCRRFATKLEKVRFNNYVLISLVLLQLFRALPVSYLVRHLQWLLVTATIGWQNATIVAALGRYHLLWYLK